jgi:hypothetical protein
MFKMLDEVKVSELEILDTFEGYYLAKAHGQTGIWKPFDNNQSAYLVDDDCAHLTLPEFEGVFSCRVLDLMAEDRILEAELKAEFGL